MFAGGSRRFGHRNLSVMFHFQGTGTPREVARVLNCGQQLRVGLFDCPLTQRCDARSYPTTAVVHPVTGMSA